MTLIYAKAEPDHIWFVSDTAVTCVANTRPQRDEVEVKFRFCGKHRFVAYAGDQHTGRKAMAKIEGIKELQCVLNTLLQYSQNGSVEFLLGDFEESSKLYKISLSIDSVPAAYIGSKIAFEVFQKFMLSDAPASFSSERNCLLHFSVAGEVESEGVRAGTIALTYAIASGSDPHVSGFVLPGLLSSGCQFVWNYAFLTTNTISNPLVSGDSYTDNCSAENGGKLDVLSTSMNKDGFALYSPLSKVGRIFLRKQGIGYSCNRFSNCSPNQLREIARKKLGVEVEIYLKDKIESGDRIREIML